MLTLYFSLNNSSLLVWVGICVCVVLFFFGGFLGNGRQGGKEWFFVFFFYYSLEHQNVSIIEVPTTIADIKDWSGLLLI